MVKIILQVIFASITAVVAFLQISLINEMGKWMFIGDVATSGFETTMVILACLYFVYLMCWLTYKCGGEVLDIIADAFS